MMRKSLCVVLMVVTLPIAGYADEYFKFVRISCVDEAKILEIQATGIHDIGDMVFREYGKSFDMAYLSKLKKKGYYLGMYDAGIIKNICMLGGNEIQTIISYAKAREKGQCGANPSAILNMKINGNNIIDNVKFHENCWEEPSIFKVSFEILNNSPFVMLLIRKGNIYYDKVIPMHQFKEKGAITIRDIEN